MLPLGNYCAMRCKTREVSSSTLLLAQSWLGAGLYSILARPLEHWENACSQTRGVLWATEDGGFRTEGPFASVKGMAKGLYRWVLFPDTV